MTPGGDPRTYSMASPTARIPQNCPIEGCPGRAATQTAMLVHFFYQNVWDTVIILWGVNLLHQQCPRYNMLVLWSAVNGRNLATAQCAKGAERKCRRLVEEDLRESTERAFQAYGKPLGTVTLFNYLIRVMTAGGDDWMAVASNLRKAWKSWLRITRILGREGADPRVSRMFFKVVFQAVFLFGSETWVLTPRMEHDLDSFWHRVVRRITGRQM